jgi:hypothetical protein
MRSIKDEFEADATRVLSERIAAFRRSVDGALSSLAAPIHLPAHASDGGGADFLDPLLGLLKTSAQGGGQREILISLLAAARSCYPRTVLFILRGNALVHWRADGATDDIPGHLSIPSGGDHILARALGSGALHVAGANGPGFVVSEALGGHLPGRAAAIPLEIRGRTVAVLYGDDGGSGSAVSETGFEVIGRIGTLALESLASTRRSRTASPQVHAQGRVSMPQIEPVHESRTDIAARSRASATIALALPHTQEPSPGSPTPPEEAEMQALLGDVDVTPRREAGDDGQSPDERRQHQDARRFASLLVSELLLYNEESVILGRKHHDLLRRLSKEIEKSRQAFAARVPAHLKGATRYLDEEMVRVLAEGDPDLLKG